MATPHLRKPIGRSPLRLALLLIPLVFACFALSPMAHAVTPAPDGAYPIQNTAEGEDALFSLPTRAGGEANTAIGARALYFNTTGYANTATGYLALSNNQIGRSNTATGHFALRDNRSGIQNTATGDDALGRNQTGGQNTAYGYGALVLNTTGSENIALGFAAGVGLTTGSQNIDIGNPGFAGESNTMRIGDDTQTRTFIAGIRGVALTGSPVVVNGSGQLGVAPSSQQFKDDIQPMGRRSEAILALKPVTFRYKKGIDPQRIPQFGLVAEEVEKVSPDLVVRDQKGKPYTVRYDQVNAMLLNEFLKEHRTVQEQQNEIDVLRAELKEQRALIQKVNDKVELAKPTSQVVNNP